jgi:hypothetical protein
LKVKGLPIQKKKTKRIPSFSDTSTPDVDMDSSPRQQSPSTDPTEDQDNDEESMAPEKNDGKSHHHHHKRERVKTTCTVSARYVNCYYEPYHGWLTLVIFEKQDEASGGSNDCMHPRAV